MKEILAARVKKIFKFIYHPLLIFYYAFMREHFSVAPEDVDAQFWIITAVVTLLTVIIPGLFYYYYAKSLFLVNKKRKLESLLFTIFCFAGCYFWLGYQISSNPLMAGWSDLLSYYQEIIILFGLVLVCMAILVKVINVSYHTAGIGWLWFMVGYTIYLIESDIFNETPSVFFVIISFLSLIQYIGLSNQAAEQDHTQREMNVGMIIGIMVPLIYVFFF